MVSDPPYGVGYDPSWRARRVVGSGKLAQGKVLNDDRADWRQAYALFTGDVAYVWHGALHGDVVGGDLTACGFELRAQIVWAKPHFTLGRGHYHWRHETCWYAVREGKAGHRQGGRKQTTVWDIANNNPFGNRQREQSWGHATQKPVECMRRPIVKQQPARRAGLRPVSRLGHEPDRGRNDRPHLLRSRDQFGLSRCHRATLASLHRAARDPSSLGAIIR
jgi:hypothetical protein